MNEWRKSSRSGSHGDQDCVELAALISATDPVVAVRDSKDPDGPRLHLDHATWTRLLTHLKVI